MSKRVRVQSMVKPSTKEAILKEAKQKDLSESKIAGQILDNAFGKQSILTDPNVRGYMRSEGGDGFQNIVMHDGTRYGTYAEYLEKQPLDGVEEK